MYRIKLSRRAKRDLKEIHQIYQAKIAMVFDELQEDPFSGKPLMRELTGQFSYRVGVFRILYRINKQDKIITILTIGHRSTV